MKSKRIEDLLRNLRAESAPEEALEAGRQKAGRAEEKLGSLIAAEPGAELRERLLALAHQRVAASRRRAAWQPAIAFAAVMLLAALDFWAAQAQTARLASISGFKDGSFRFVPPYVLQQQIAALMEPDRYMR